MSFNRVKVEGAGKTPTMQRSGDGWVAGVLPAIRAAETDETLTVQEVTGGSLLQVTTLTSDVTYTLPTVALLLLELTNMDIGDSFSFFVTNAQAGAFDVLLAVGVGMTAIGANNDLEVAPKTTKLFTLVKTAAATMDLY